MENNMYNNGKKGLSFVLIVAVIALAAFSAMLITGLIFIGNESAYRKTTIENLYQKSLYDMADSASNLEVNLSKLMVADSKQESFQLINDTASCAELAQSSLAQLPLDAGNVRKTSKYFNQVSDWCSSYTSAISQKADTSVYLEQAETLYEAARNINENLREIMDVIGDKNITDSVGGKRLLTADFELSFDEMENHTVEYPQLIYDGPFSDSKKYTFSALEGKEEIDENAAVKAAEEMGLTNANLLGLTGGKTDIYLVEGNNGDGMATVSVTKRGGLIIGYNYNRTVDTINMGYNEISALAVDSVQKLGYENLVPVWYNDSDGIGFINLAPEVDGITYYTDLIKVKVALDNGDILGIEATGYCQSYREREYQPVLDDETAVSLVSKKLDINAVKLAVIPDGEDEAFCYEVNGNYKGLDYFVYVDAVDGKQIDVLRVVDSNQGSLVM